MPTVVHPADLPHEVMVRTSTGEALGLSADLGATLGLKKVRAHHEVLPPGRRSSPPHHHTEKEELVLVLSGRPILYLDGARQELGPGDVVGFPAGETVKHSLVNESEEEVSLLVVSVDSEGDVVTY